MTVLLNHQENTFRVERIKSCTVTPNVQSCVTFRLYSSTGNVWERFICRHIYYILSSCFTAIFHVVTALNQFQAQLDVVIDAYMAVPNYENISLLSSLLWLGFVSATIQKWFIYIYKKYNIYLNLWSCFTFAFRWHTEHWSKWLMILPPLLFI